MKKGKSSESQTVPLRTMRPAEEHEEPFNCKRQLQLVTTSPFRLPDDWFVEEKRRPLSNICNPGKIDRYYIEADTGLRFRSLPAVQRYLTEGQTETFTKRIKPGSECLVSSRIQKVVNPKHKQITPCTTRRTSSSFKLPDGWEIEEKPRRKSRVIDKTYIEPVTGRQFRSLVAVERYLTEANEEVPLKALMPATKSSISSGSCHQKTKSSAESEPQNVGSSSLKRNISGENDRPSELNFGRPPAKVKWVLRRPGGNMWNPVIDDSKVPDSVKQSWSESFKSSLSGGNISAPIL
ncbi:hypothetical protein ACFX2I_029454 [Malus domestica]